MRCDHLGSRSRRRHSLRSFFQSGDIAERLLIALDYACANWESAKQRWLGLFFGVAQPKQRRQSSGENDIVSECELAEALKTFGAQARALKKARSTPEPPNLNQRVQVLLLVVDEARSLFDMKNASGSNSLYLLRKAQTTPCATRGAT